MNQYQVYTLAVSRGIPPYVAGRTASPPRFLLLGDFAASSGLGAVRGMTGRLDIIRCGAGSPHKKFRVKNLTTGRITFYKYK